MMRYVYVCAGDQLPGVQVVYTCTYSGSSNPMQGRAEMMCQGSDDVSAMDECFSPVSPFTSLLGAERIE